MLWSLRAKGVCMRCGFKYELRDLRKEWTGERVCSDCFDPEPTERKPIPRLRPEGLPKPNASPEPNEIFITPGVNDITKDDL